MIQLTFYKGVPFSTENKDVLFVSESERQLFLKDYEINAVPIQIDKFAVNGTDDNSIIDVTLEQEPFDTNYLKVVQELDTLNERTIYYFVNSVQTVAPNTFRLNLTVDIWNTYFLKTNATSTDYEIPLMKNALCISGHGFENGGEAEEQIDGTKSLKIFSATKIGISTTFRIVYHISTASDKLNETCLISQQTYSFNNAMRTINLLSQISTVVLRTEDADGKQTQDNVAIQGIDIFLIPDDFFGENSSTLLNAYDLATAYFDGQSTIFFWTANLTRTKDGITFHALRDFDVTPTKAKITWIGTGKQNIQLPYNNKTYKIYSRVAIGNDIAIELFANNQTIHVTQDYQVNFSISEFASYVSTHKNSDYLRQVSQNIAGFAGSASMIVGVATGNAKMILGGAGALGGVATSEFNYKAKMSDMASQPLKLASDTETILILYYYNGFSKFELEPSNYDDIIAYDNYFGYKFDGFYDTLSIDALAETDRFRFLQCSEINLIGKFTMGVKNALESLFKRGLRIWYHKEHYLDSQAQQIDKKQGE